MVDHWRDLELSFDALYSGFLGSSEQIEIVENFIDGFAGGDEIVLVDPVMGDEGKPYGPMKSELIRGMRRLVRKARVITPNFTEACFLLDREYAETLEPEEMKEWLVQLSELGPPIVIATSVPVSKDGGSSAVIAYNREDGRFWKVDCTYIPAYYPGTGDAFASVVLGSLLQGDSLPIALDRAVQFVSLAIKASFGYALPRREGVLLERVLSNLKAPLTSITCELVGGGPEG
jgi:pyridoxine kinase